MTGDQPKAGRAERGQLRNQGHGGHGLPGGGSWAARPSRLGTEGWAVREPGAGAHQHPENNRPPAQVCAVQSAKSVHHQPGPCWHSSRSRAVKSQKQENNKKLCRQLRRRSRRCDEALAAPAAPSRFSADLCRPSTCSSSRHLRQGAQKSPRSELRQQQIKSVGRQNLHRNQTRLWGHFTAVINYLALI